MNPTARERRSGGHVAESTCSSLSDYVKVRTVGRGSFGEALLVKHRTTGQLSVLKRVRLEVVGSGSDAVAAAESAAREAQVLHQLRHPHIVEFLAAFVDSSRDSSGSTLCLLMAFFEGGDLQHRLQKVRQECRRLQEPPALRWFDELCSALAYVHQHHVLHRDLKPSNIFLTGRSSGSAHCISEEESVAIGDFGVSRPLTHAMELVTTMVGTPCYLSPEVCKGKPYSYKSDIWSLGCVLYEMMALRPPFGTAPNLEALVTRIIRADVSLPENITNEYPEASRCTRAMLRQLPERRPTAMSLLNRPRLQPPTYELPGMESTCVTKVFDPPNRETGRSLPAEQVALAAAAANNAVKAALSPRIRPKLGLHLEEAPRMTVEGADRPTRRPKGVMEDPPECIRKANGPYPSSPVIVAAKVPPVSHGSRTPALSSQRTASREAKHSNAQPLSARPKAYHPQVWPQPHQRSPRGSPPRSDPDRTEGTARSSSLTPRSPPGEDSKFKHRREERSRQSQAFRQWLREQRAKGKESPGSMADSSQSPIQEESSPCDLTTESVAPELADQDKLNESREATSRSPTSPSQPRRKSKVSPPKQEWRTEIYCPGFPVITVEDEVELQQTDPSRTMVAKKQLQLSEVEVPRGPADVGGTPADTMEVVTQHWISPEGSLPATKVLSTHTAPEKKEDCESQATVCSKLGQEVSFNEAQTTQQVVPGIAGPKAFVLDDSKKSVSIGDRIEGIRACLEARMGTQRFQKLYKSLTKDDAAVNSLSGSSVSWPRDSSMFLPEDIDEAFIGAGDGGSDDVNSLIPLVAKLVACEQSYFS